MGRRGGRIDRVLQAEGGVRRSVTLCYPGLADIERSMVSVPTPIGAALLGLSPGQQIERSGRDGQSHIFDRP
ncbi:UNVERIFIED_ORG: transcription elongation GreA/GreB family factor [Rhizobium sp. SORGH_AS 755]|nr:transcription elongation GreA/GreB family factor [Rhizobium sp. SORGH_AS_0755]